MNRECKGVIARRDFAPRDDRRPPWLSRDWDLEGRINCNCEECIANDGRGRCGAPALVKISNKGKCSGYKTIPKEIMEKVEKVKNTKRVKKTKMKKKKK